MNQNRQVPAILSLGTTVPRYSARQEAIGQWMAASFAEQPKIGRWLRQLYAHSGIETRHTCIPDFLEPPERSRLAPGQHAADTLTTAERMAIYQRESIPLGTRAGRRALNEYAAAASSPLSTVRDSVTHLIVVSCTGFFAPGLDLAIAQQLKLAPNVARTLIGFMGCSAAFNGLRIATQIVNSQPEARVLVICVELCSLHIQPGTVRENLISAALFADGAAACLVGKPSPNESNIFTINGFHTSLKPDTTSEMMWQIGDHGFTLRLSPQVPAHLGEAGPAALAQLLGSHPRPRFWAIHPGGKAIVDGLARIFQLEPDQVRASRSVLRRVGNISSATILFVLDSLRRQLQQEGSNNGAKELNGVAMAFGPGLVIEMARLSYVPALTRRIETEKLNSEMVLA